MVDHEHGEGEAEARVLRGLRWAVELSAIILVIEAAGAFFSRSLSLTVDAVHNLPDLLAFAVSWAAVRGTATGATDQYTFGTHRREVFAGILNGLLVLGTGLLFGYTALLALRSGSNFAGPVDPIWLLVAAVPTLSLRAVSLRMIGRIPGRVRDLNLRSVIVHLASDVAITCALVADGLVLLTLPGHAWVDPVAALVIAVILVYESVPLLRDGADVLTERTPRRLSVDAIRSSALDVPGVAQVHDLHVWSVCSSLVCLTAHVQVREMPLSEAMTVLDRLRNDMEAKFGILHATFQIEGPSEHHGAVVSP